MPTAYAYLRLADDELENFPAIQRHQQDAERYFHKHLAPRGFTWGRVFIDEVDSVSKSLLDRPQGRELNYQLGQGDALILPDFPRSFATSRDFEAVLELLEKRQVELIVSDVGVMNSPEYYRSVSRLAGQLAGAEKSRHAERMRASHARRPADSPRARGNPPHGFRWEGRAGERHLVPDPKEREIMGRIVERREQGWSWERISMDLLTSGLRTRNGREWSTTRVWRAHQAELRLRAAPAPGPTKRCRACGVAKPPTEEHFHRAPSQPDGLKSKCRACVSQRRKAIRQKAKQQATQKALRSREKALIRRGNSPFVNAAYRRIMAAFRNPENFAKEFLASLYAAPAGSPQRALLLRSMIRLAIQGERRGPRTPVDELGS